MIRWKAITGTETDDEIIDERCVVKYRFSEDDEYRYEMKLDCPYGWNVLENTDAYFLILPE